MRLFQPAWFLGHGLSTRSARGEAWGPGRGPIEGETRASHIQPTSGLPRQ